MQAHTHKQKVAAMVASSCMVACSPALDWRELSVSEAALVAHFPCKPSQTVVVDRGLLHCEAQGARFSVSWLKLDDPGRLHEAVQAAPGLLAGRLGPEARPSRPGVAAQVAIPQGALAWSESGLWQIDAGGRKSYLLVWARGLTLYQAVVYGGGAQDQVAQHFFQGLSHGRFLAAKG